MKRKKMLFFASSFMILVVTILIGYYLIFFMPLSKQLSIGKEPNKTNIKGNDQITKTPTTTASVEEKISNENVTGMSKSISLHLNESQRLSGRIATKSSISSLIISAISSDGKPLGIYLSMRPRANKYDLSEVIVDTDIEPFNKPGVYKMQIWAKTVGSAADTKIGEIAVEVLPLESTMLNVDIVKIDTTSYPTIKAAFIATDRTGKLIENIMLNQVLVYEKNSLNAINEMGMAVEKLEIASDTDTGVNLVLTLDSSLSMYNKDKSEKGSLMEKAKRSAISFIESKKLSAKDKVAVTSFGKDFTIHQTFTSDKTKLIKAINSIKSRSNTAIYDAVAKSINMLKVQSGSGSLIIFTDGEDNSSKLNYMGAITIAQKAKISVFSIAVGESAKTNEFKSISDKTGGEFYYLKDPKMLSSYYDRITRNIKNQYIVTYKSTTGDSIKERVLRLFIKHVSGDASVQKSYIK